MKQGQGSKRTRGRSGGRRGSNRQQLFDSNGPSVRIRGNAFQVHEKYLALARDAAGAGDRVAAENYYQHAEHYFRIYSADQEERAQRSANNGHAADSNRRHSGNGADRSQNQPHNAGNGDGRHEHAKANGANGSANGAADESDNTPAVSLDTEIDLTASSDDASDDVTVAAESGEQRPAPARRPRRRKPASND
jgi:hypothetical protein